MRNVFLGLRVSTLGYWMVLGVWLGLYSGPTFAQSTSSVAPEAVGLSSEQLETVPKAVSRLIADRNIAGAVVLVARQGQIVLLDAQGLRDVSSQSPMQSDTLFRIYSMTKPVTSVAVLMLMEQGKLDLDDPIGQYLPELANLDVHQGLRRRVPLQRPVTIRDLLRHTSGFTYGFFSAHFVDGLYMKNHPLFSRDADKMLAKLSALPLVYQPGTRWHYSVSTDVLGALVERVSGQSLGEFFQANIFQPLGMVDTSFHVSDAQLSRFASSYDGFLNLVEWFELSPYRMPERFQSGGGGLVSTATDYFYFCQMLLNGGTFNGHRLLKEDTVAAMTRNQLPEGVWTYGVFGFGLGVQVQMQDWGTKAHLGQYGWDGAASTHFWISPEDELIFIALSQRQPFSKELKETLTPLVYEALQP